MIRTKFPMVAPLILALIGAFGWLLQMQAQDSSKDNKTPYPSMAPLEQYLMPRMRKLPRHGARPRNPYPATQRSWSSDAVASKLP